MAGTKKGKPQTPIEAYEHAGKQRTNNPPAGLVTPDTDPDAGKRQTYSYDPHLDPQLQWAGKAEHTSFEVPTSPPSIPRLHIANCWSRARTA